MWGDVTPQGKLIPVPAFKTDLMNALEFKIIQLEHELRREQIKTLKLRMRMSVLIQHPGGTAAEKIATICAPGVDLEESVFHLN